MLVDISVYPRHGAVRNAKAAGRGAEAFGYGWLHDECMWTWVTLRKRADGSGTKLDLRHIHSGTESRNYSIGTEAVTSA